MRVWKRGQWVVILRGWSWLPHWGTYVPWAPSAPLFRWWEWGPVEIRRALASATSGQGGLEAHEAEGVEMNRSRQWRLACGVEILEGAGGAFCTIRATPFMAYPDDLEQLIEDLKAVLPEWRVPYSDCTVWERPSAESASSATDSETAERKDPAQEAYEQAKATAWEEGSRE